MEAPAPVFIVNRLSETVARKGSVLNAIAKDHDASLYIDNIFDNLDKIITCTQKNLQNWVFIEGGDGTVQGVLTAFTSAYKGRALPRFTLIPGGMTNQVAGVIGHKSRRANSIGRLLQTGGSVIKVPLLRVRSMDVQDLEYVGFLFSTGAVPMITDYTKSKLHSRGIGGSMAVLGGILKGVKGQNSDVISPTHIKIKYNDEVMNSSHLGTIATTLPNIFMGLDPFWGRSQDGDIRMTFADANCRKLLSNILSLWRGNNQKDRRADGLYSFNSDSITLEYDGPVVLDGEALTLLGNSFKIGCTDEVTFLC